MRRSILLTLVSVVFALALPAAAADSPCADCHDEVAAEMANQIHMRIEPFEVYGRQVGCEGCHGDGTKHMEEGDPSLIRTFSNRHRGHLRVSRLPLSEGTGRVDGLDPRDGKHLVSRLPLDSQDG